MAGSNFLTRKGRPSLKSESDGLSFVERKGELRELPVCEWVSILVQKPLLTRMPFNLKSNRLRSTMAFAHAHKVDARYSMFQEIHGNIVISDQGGTKGNDMYRCLSAPDPSSNQFKQSPMQWYKCYSIKEHWDKKHKKHSRISSIIYSAPVPEDYISDYLNPPSFDTYVAPGCYLKFYYKTNYPWPWPLSLAHPPVHCIPCVPHQVTLAVTNDYHWYFDSGQDGQFVSSEIAICAWAWVTSVSKCMSEYLAPCVHKQGRTSVVAMIQL
jgi:hypothetical protein